MSNAKALLITKNLLFFVAVLSFAGFIAGLALGELQVLHISVVALAVMGFFLIKELELKQELINELFDQLDSK